MINKQKLELTWIGKENRPRLEPRILLEDPEKSYHAQHRVTDHDLFDTIEVIQRSFARKPVSYLTSDPAMQAAVLKEVAETVTPKQGELAGVVEQPRIAEIVKQVTAMLPDMVIQIPRIVVAPKGDVLGGYRDFDLDASGITQQPVSEDVLVQTLRTNELIRLKMEMHGGNEDSLEAYLVRHLIDKDDIDYDRHAELLNKLAGQVVARLRSYLPDDAAVANVIQYNQLKSQAAVAWCKHATDHENSSGGKPWFYILIPHDAITGNMTLEGLASRFAVSS